MDIESKLNALRLEVAEAINILAMCGDKTPVNQLGEKLCKALNASAAPVPAMPMQDHEIAETINSIRDIAVKYRDTQQLREQIASILRPLLRSSKTMPIPKQEPIGKICKSAECGGVDFYFDIIPDGETMLYAVPQPAQAAAMPEYLSAIEVLRENIRNPDRGVEYCGIFDNDKTRAAIGTLLSAAPKPE